jgi:thioredoxin reductase (NADPH)
MKEYDALVLGGGPAGLTAAMYLARSEVSLALVEKLSPGGQTLMTHIIENYPGFPEGVEGWQLADLFARHLDKYDLARYGDEVLAIEPGEKLHKVKVGQEWLAAKALVVCSGAQYRRLGLPGEKELLGRGVSYCALCDGNFFKGQDVAVIGGGNSALEESLYLAKLVNKLHLIHRRDLFRGQKCIQNKCEINPKIVFHRSSVVKQILGDKAVEGVLVENLTSNEEYRLPVSGVFIFVGTEPQGDFLPKELEKDSAGFLVTDLEMRTNIKGIFAAGDIRSKACRQVATAVGDGATAATAAHAYLEKLHV